MFIIVIYVFLCTLNLVACSYPHEERALMSVPFTCNSKPHTFPTTLQPQVVVFIWAHRTRLNLVVGTLKTLKTTGMGRANKTATTVIFI